MLYQIPTDNHSLNDIPKKYPYTYNPPTKSCWLKFKTQYSHTHSAGTGLYCIYFNTEKHRTADTEHDEMFSPKNSLKFNSVCVWDFLYIFQCKAPIMCFLNRFTLSLSLYPGHASDHSIDVPIIPWFRNLPYDHFNFDNVTMHGGHFHRL